MIITSEVINYKCPNCGATLPFNGKEGSMKCEFCGSSFDPETLRQYDEALKNEKNEEPDFEDSAREEWTEDGMLVCHCQSCGAEIVTEATTAATFCPYCGNTTIVTGSLSGVLKPDIVIPFKLSKADALAALKRFYKGKLFLPKSFADSNKTEKIAGMYVPFWLFDGDADANISYNATRVSVTRSSNYETTRTMHYLLQREGGLGFDGIPVDGSQKMDDAYMEAIEPYNYAEAVDFASAYLSGYLADKYDVDAESSKPRANARIKESVSAEFAKTAVGYASVTPRSSSIKIANGRIRYALLPVWMLNTKYSGKTYTFAMNGQTGKFVGELPTDKGKFWGFLLGLTAAITVIASLFIFLM